MLTDLNTLRGPLSYTSIYSSQDRTTGVVRCSTPVGPTVLKTWSYKRVILGQNYLQPASEYAAQQRIGNHALFNTPVSIELEQKTVQCYYVSCGQDIQRWRQSIGHLPDAVVNQLTQHVGAQLLMALQQLQLRGLVHRDVTPMNVLMRFSTTGQPGDVLLGDFGLMCTARQLSGFFPGYNLSYILPEFIVWDDIQQLYVINPDSNALCYYATTEADVFQAGWCLYELFTGRRPPGLEAVPCEDDPVALSNYLWAVLYCDWQSAIDKYVRPKSSTLADLLELMLLPEPSHRAPPAVLLQQQYVVAEYMAAEAGFPDRQQRWVAERKEVSSAVDVVKAKLAIARLTVQGKLVKPSFTSAAAQAAADDVDDGMASAAAANLTDASHEEQQQCLSKFAVTAARHATKDIAPVSSPVAFSGGAEGCESMNDGDLELAAGRDDLSSGGGSSDDLAASTTTSSNRTPAATSGSSSRNRHGLAASGGSSCDDSLAICSSSRNSSSRAAYRDSGGKGSRTASRTSCNSGSHAAISSGGSISSLAAARENSSSSGDGTIAAPTGSSSSGANIQDVPACTDNSPILQLTQPEELAAASNVCGLGWAPEASPAAAAAGGVLDCCEVPDHTIITTCDDRSVQAEPSGSSVQVADGSEVCHDVDAVDNLDTSTADEVAAVTAVADMSHDDSINQTSAQHQPQQEVAVVNDTVQVPCHSADHHLEWCCCYRRSLWGSVLSHVGCVLAGCLVVGPVMARIRRS